MKRYVMVMIPKGKDNFYFIGIVKVLWKLMYAIINGRLHQYTILHKKFHVFWFRRGMVTTIIEAKFYHQLESFIWT